MEEVLGVIAAIVLAGAALGTFVLVKTVRALRRHVDHTKRQARRMAEEAKLRAKSVQPGALGQLAALRLELRGSMSGTQQALESGVAGDPSLREALELLERLRAHAHALDSELGLMEREPDRARIAARLPELRERAERITHSADSLRWAAQDRARQFADDDLAALGRQIEVEAGALRHWVPAEAPRVTAEAPRVTAEAPGVAAEAPGVAATEKGTERAGDALPPTTPARPLDRPDRLGRADRSRERR
jgi:hypothetical protein